MCARAGARPAVGSVLTVVGWWANTSQSYNTEGVYPNLQVSQVSAGLLRLMVVFNRLGRWLGLTWC